MKEAAIKKLIEAVEDLADTENNDGCSDDLTVVNFIALTDLLKAKRALPQ